MEIRLRRIDSYSRAAPPDLELSPLTTPEAHVTFLTFGGGSNRYRRAAKALGREAARTGWFDQTYALVDDTEHPLVSGLMADHGEFIRSERRGYGLWIWKPWLVNQLLDRLKPGDLLVYADSGCELSALGKERFASYLALALEGDGLFFDIPFIEREWTKPSLVARLSNAMIDLDSRQIQATWFILKVGDRSRALARAWLAECSGENYEALRIPAVTSQHRSDQSVLSLLVKLYGLQRIQWEDRYASQLYVPNSWVLLFPVHARRAVWPRYVYLLSTISSSDAAHDNLTTPSLTFVCLCHVKRFFDVARATLSAATKRWR